jgi:ParB family chromosome partitioning protein
MTHQQAADAVGRSRPAASNLLRLLQLAPPVQELLMAGDIDMGHARRCCPRRRHPDRPRQPDRRPRPVGARSRTPGTSGLNPKSKQPAPPPTGTSCAWRRIADQLGATVKIKANNKGAGAVTIHFGSLDQLDGLLDRLNLKS